MLVMGTGLSDVLGAGHSGLRRPIPWAAGQHERSWCFSSCNLRADRQYPLIGITNWIPHPIIGRIWLPLFGLCIYMLLWLGWWLYRVLSLDVEPGVAGTPDIDRAWARRSGPWAEPTFDWTRRLCSSLWDGTPARKSHSFRRGESRRKSIRCHGTTRKRSSHSTSPLIATASG